MFTITENPFISFSGLSAVIQLKKKLGISAQVFESESCIGGTWNYNQYPGCACDVSSHLYSFSFDLNPSKYLKLEKKKCIGL